MNTEEIKDRLVCSLIPFNKKFFTLYKEKPDLYGPFWIYTTLIVILAIAGNFHRALLLPAGEKFKYNFNYVPIAATVIYGIGFGLPFALKIIMKFMGAGFFASSFIEVVGIYGYSFSSFLITGLLCALPYSGLQWALIGYSAITSTGFLMVTYWHDLK